MENLTLHSFILSYEEMLNELYPVDVAGYQFNASEVLWQNDKVAWQEGLFDFADSEGVNIDKLEEDCDICPQTF